jgi:hypothetical protein
MNFEVLPNEILLDLFDYFDDVDLFRVFYGLNSRFNFLLYNQFRIYRFNFKSVSQRTLDMVCQQHLPFIADRISALSLSGGKETPEQINLFFSYIPSFSQLIQLHSLTVFNLRSNRTTLKIIQKCHELCNLTHLKFQSCYIPNDRINFQLIMNMIWELPKLTHCDFGLCITGWANRFLIPMKTSTSLKYLSISQYDVIILCHMRK